MKGASIAAGDGYTEDVRPVPIPNSYWLPGARVVAGEYPGHEDETRAREKIGALLDAGVRVFFDLTTAADRLTPYESILAAEARQRGVEASRLSLPIRDMDVAPPEVLNHILDLLDEHAAASIVVYVHCWGGVGRTGLVIGCHLVRLGATGDEALATVRRLFGTMSTDKVRDHGGQSPQTMEQCDAVRTWARHDCQTPRRDSE